MMAETIEFLEEQCTKDKSFKYEIIIVSDGSRDNTVAVAQTYVDKWGSDKIRVLNLEENRGKGGAVRLVSLQDRFGIAEFTMHWFY